LGLHVDCEQFLGHGDGVGDTWTINSGYDPGGVASVSYISIFTSVGWSFLYSHPPLYIFHFKNKLFFFGFFLAFYFGRARCSSQCCCTRHIKQTKPEITKPMLAGCRPSQTRAKLGLARCRDLSFKRTFTITTCFGSLNFGKTAMFKCIK
jgi:hypothetical protein